MFKITRTYSTGTDGIVNNLNYFGEQTKSETFAHNSRKRWHSIVLEKSYHFCCYRILYQRIHVQYVLRMQ